MVSVWGGSRKAGRRGILLPGQLDGINRQTDGQRNTKTDRKTGRQTGIPIYRWTDKQTDGHCN